jgi:diamine N-acetyltransferase
MIEDKSSQSTIGAIDLYDFDPHNRRAGIGIFVIKEFQNKGFAKKSLQLLLHYCKTMLLLHQVYAEVPSKNEISLALFANAGFQQCGVRKDWLLRGQEYEDVVMMQKIL